MWSRIESFSLVVLLLLSVTAVISASRWSSEEDETENKSVSRKQLDLLYKLAETNCPNVRHTLDADAIKEMGFCVSLKLDMPTPEPKLAGGRDLKTGLGVGFLRKCGQFPVIQSCMKPLTDAVQQCVPHGDKLIKVHDSAIGFLCDNPDRLINFFSEANDTCISAGALQFQSCALKLLPLHADTKEDPCKSLVMIQDCASTGFSQCKDPNLFPELIHHVVKSLECPAEIVSLLRSGNATSTAHTNYCFHGLFAVPIMIFANNYLFPQMQ